jgi:hypothetical protein
LGETLSLLEGVCPGHQLEVQFSFNLPQSPEP